MRVGELGCHKEVYANSFLRTVCGTPSDLAERGGGDIL